MRNEVKSGESNCYAPWTPPFEYDTLGSWIIDAKGERLCDIRAWGWLTGHGSGGLALSEEAAAKIQDSVAHRIVALLNADAAHNASNDVSEGSAAE